MVGQGQGGGQRVSSARLVGEGCDATDIARACAVMDALDQKPSFAVFDSDPPALDTALAAQGFAMGDRVALMALALQDDVHGDVTAHWPPIPAQAALWQAAGIGPARLAIMARAPAPRAALALHVDGSLAACAFVALDRGIAVLHALEVIPALRRQGLGRRMMQGAASWARAQGAMHLALLVVEGNLPARALYDGLGYHRVTGMHYRIKAKT